MNGTRRAHRTSRVALISFVALASAFGLLLILSLAASGAPAAAPPVSTTTELTSAPNPSVFGKLVTFSATVTSTLGLPTGVVTFTVDGATTVTRTLANGQAAFTTTLLSVGKHPVRAVYGGDGSFEPSVSPVLTQTVRPVSELSFPLIAKAPPCLPVFADDFSDSASGWPAWNGDISAAGYDAGEYRILVKRANYFTAATPGVSVGNFRARVDARPTSHLDGSHGMVFGFSQVGLYLFEISGDQFMLSRYALDSDSWTVLVGPATHSAIRPGNVTNRLEVERSGVAIKLYANGQLIQTWQDAVYMTGSVGVMSAAGRDNYEARFDNYVLYDGSCTPPAGAAGSTVSPAPNAALVLPAPAQLGLKWPFAGAMKPSPSPR